jgi:hypothetical protein
LRFNLVWFLHSDSPFLGKRKLLLAYQGCERRVATFYDLPGIPGEIRDTRQLELSSDLKTLTIAVRLTGESKPKNVLVFDRE